MNYYKLSRLLLYALMIALSIFVFYRDVTLLTPFRVICSTLIFIVVSEIYIYNLEEFGKNDMANMLMCNIIIIVVSWYLSYMTNTPITNGRILIRGTIIALTAIVPFNIMVLLQTKLSKY